MNADFRKSRVRRHVPVALIAAAGFAAWIATSWAALPPRPVIPDAPAKPLMLAKPASAPPAASTTVPMKRDSGVFVVPVSVNGMETFDCIVDSGASDVNIPTGIFRKLVRAGSVKESDYLGTSEYTLADGSTVRGRTFRIKSLKVGSVVVNNVVASVGGDASSGLLGQSFLTRFRSWSFDNSRHALVLVGAPSPGPHVAPTAVAGARPPRDPHDGAQSVPHDGSDARTPPPARSVPPAVAWREPVAVPQTDLHGGIAARRPPPSGLVAQGPATRAPRGGDAPAAVPSRRPYDPPLTAQRDAW